MHVQTEAECWYFYAMVFFTRLDKSGFLMLDLKHESRMSRLCTLTLMMHDSWVQLVCSLLFTWNSPCLFHKRLTKKRASVRRNWITNWAYLQETIRLKEKKRPKWRTWSEDKRRTLLHYSDIQDFLINSTRKPNQWTAAEPSKFFSRTTLLLKYILFTDFLNV